MTAGYSIMKKAPVNKIIPFSNVDGPGNRTAVFFQGCTFSCLYCHNPETIRICDNCGACVSVCPSGALRADNGNTVWDERLCVQCDACIKTCPNMASPRVRWMTVEEVFLEIRRTAAYIDGVTVSGGECSLYHAFLEELFPLVRGLGKTCLADSNGSLDWSLFPSLTEVCDGVMLDIKAVDPAWCMELLGNDGSMPLKNLVFLLRQGKLQEVRTVLFPHRAKENEQTVSAVSGIIGGRCPYKLIRYRPFGVRPGGLAFLGDETTPPAEAERCLKIAHEAGAFGAFIV